MSKRSIGAVAFALLLGGIAHLSALNVSSHRLVNIAAADYEQFDLYLKEGLGFSAGRNAILQQPKTTALDLLAIGGEREDDGPLFSGRFHNHFHDPLEPWSEAGLHALRHQSSSIHWMQDPTQSPGGNWTWQRARELYLQALTAPDARTREAAA